MGGSYIASQAERERLERMRQQQKAQERRDAVALASRIIDHLNKVIIRPGPKPEERECTTVARELKGEIPTIADLILGD